MGMLKNFKPGEEPNMSEFFGPMQVDHMIRQAIQFCWMGLPTESKTPEHVAEEIRRILERALKDLKEDARSFGIGEGDKPKAK